MLDAKTAAVSSLRYYLEDSSAKVSVYCRRRSKEEQRDKQGAGRWVRQRLRLVKDRRVRAAATLQGRAETRYEGFAHARAHAECHPHLVQRE